MSKSLGRLDVVRDVNTSLKTQSSTLTFHPGRPIDFRALAAAVDKAGFKAGTITIWAKGTLSVQSDGLATFTVSGTNQNFPLADSPALTPLKSQPGEEIAIVARVLFAETPPRLVLGVTPEKSGMEGTKGMGEMKGMEGMKGMK